MKQNRIIDEIRYVAKTKIVKNEELYNTIKGLGCISRLVDKSLFQCMDKKQYIFNMIQIKQRYSSCIDLFEALRNIRYVHLKGAPLSQRIYGDYAIRMSGDIDLLIDINDEEYVVNMIKEMGFIQARIVNGNVVKYNRESILYHKLYTHQLATFIRETNSPILPYVCLDVNLGLMWGNSNDRIDISEFICHNEHIFFENSDISVLMPMWEFLHLCMHAYRDMNSIYIIQNNGIRFDEILDLYFYLKQELFDIEELMIKARLYHCDKYVYYCIYYINKIFEDDYTKYAISKFKDSDYVNIIEHYGLDERIKWNYCFLDRVFNTDFIQEFKSGLSEKQNKYVRTIDKYMI